MSERIHRALAQLARKQVPVPVLSGTVVDVSDYTCDVQPNDGGAVYFDVRLKVAVNSQDVGTYAIPNTGSEVLIAMLNGDANNMVVLQVESVKEYVVKVAGGAELRIKPNGMMAINGEQYGGLVKVQELRSELAKVNTFLTALRTAINAAIISPGDGGAALKTAMASAIGNLSIPTYNGIESNKTKHGSL